MVKQAQGTFETNGVEQEVIEEYVPKYDIKISIGVEKPKDREYWIQTATTLFQTIDPMTGQPMIDAQALRYVVENGRMEPFSVIDERMKRDQVVIQKVQELEMQNAQLQEQNQLMQQEIGQAQRENMSSQAEVLKAENERGKAVMQSQQQHHSQEMDKAKLVLEAEKIAQMGQRQSVGAR
jgi:hypothetical protein